MPYRNAPLWRRDPRPGLLVIAFGIAAAAFAALAAMVMLYHPFVAFDQRVSAAVRSLQTPALDSFFRAVTHVGDYWSTVPLTAALVLLLVLKKRPAEAFLVGFTVGVGAALGSLLRELFERARPALDLARIPTPDSYSFPSGHALGTFLLAGMVFFVVALEAKGAAKRGWVLLGCVVVAGLVALSRVYLGVHWVGDVIASWILGAAWMTLNAAAYFAFTKGERPQ